MEIDLGGVGAFVAEAQRDDGAVEAGGEEPHRGGLPQNVSGGRLPARLGRPERPASSPTRSPAANGTSALPCDRRADRPIHLDREEPVEFEDSRNGATLRLRSPSRQGVSA